MGKGDGTAALAKALTVLERVGASPQGISHTDLLEQTGLPKTTLYRILATLIDRGLLRRDTSHKSYRLGFPYLELIRNAYLMPDLVAAATPELRALRNLTGETTYLAALDGTEVISLERCDGAHSQRSSASLGRSKPVYCTGQGKAILSRMSPQERDALLHRVTLTPLTPNTLTDRRRLNADLRMAATRGYAIDDEEIRMGVRCVAAPIVDAAGRVRGALSMAGPSYRMSLRRLELLGPEIAESARHVGSLLDIPRTSSEHDEVVPIGAHWAFHGACPVWSGADQNLYWADTLAPAIHVFDGREDRIMAQLDHPVRSLQARPEGLLVAQETGHLLLTNSGDLIAHDGISVWNDPDIALLCTDGHGVTWACLRRERKILLGFINAEHRFEGCWSFQENITAMAWTPEGTTAYAGSAQSGAIYALQRGDSTVRRLTSMPPGSGQPSGIATDHRHGIWVALQDGWSLTRFSHDGTLSRIVSLPVAAPTGLAFVHSRGHSPALYITSDRNQQSISSLASAPLSGRLLRLELEP